MTEAQFVTPETLKAMTAERRVVECAEGRCYEVRALTCEEVIECLGAVPDLAAVAGNGRAVSSRDMKRNVEVAQSFAAKALTRPAVGDGDGEVPLSLIPFGDLLRIAAAVQSLSGMTADEAERLRPTSADASS